MDEVPTHLHLTTHPPVQWPPTGHHTQRKMQCPTFPPLPTPPDSLKPPTHIASTLEHRHGICQCHEERSKECHFHSGSTQRTRVIRTHGQSMEMGLGRDGRTNLPPHKAMCRLRPPPSDVAHIDSGGPTETKPRLLPPTLLPTNPATGSIRESA